MEITNRDNLSIVSLQLHHVYDLRDWDKYEDPLFYDYNFPDLDDYEVTRWFDLRVSQPDAKSFAVVNDENKTIGLINIKNIRRILKVANLGIVFDRKYVNSGYGTTGLKAVLRYYFEEMNMRTLYLDVAVHNKRAIRCYEKCGFIKVKTYIIKLQGVDIEDIPLDDMDEKFVIKNGLLYIYCYKMKLSKNDYIRKTIY